MQYFVTTALFVMLLALIPAFMTMKAMQSATDTKVTSRLMTATNELKRLILWSLNGLSNKIQRIALSTWLIKPLTNNRIK